MTCGKLESKPQFCPFPESRFRCPQLMWTGCLGQVLVPCLQGTRNTVCHSDAWIFIPILGVTSIKHQLLKCLHKEREWRSCMGDVIFISSTLSDPIYAVLLIFQASLEHFHFCRLDQIFSNPQESLFKWKHQWKNTGRQWKY